jgi:hypothetical protein
MLAKHIHTYMMLVAIGYRPYPVRSAEENALCAYLQEQFVFVSQYICTTCGQRAMLLQSCSPEGNKIPSSERQSDASNNISRGQVYLKGREQSFMVHELNDISKLPPREVCITVFSHCVTCSLQLHLMTKCTGIACVRACACEQCAFFINRTMGNHTPFKPQDLVSKWDKNKQQLSRSNLKEGTYQDDSEFPRNLLTTPIHTHPCTIDMLVTHPPC